jgi:hypothetical protein
MTTNDVLEINAAFYNLINQTDIEKASYTLIAYARTLPYKRGSQIEYSKKSTSTDSFSGQTDLGNANLSETTTKETHRTWGFQKARVGHFKAWRGKKCLYFHHFWKSDASTAGDEPEVITYRLRFSPKNFTLEHFGFISERQLFKIGWFSFMREESVGLSGGKTERLSNYIDISINT